MSQAADDRRYLALFLAVALALSLYRVGVMWALALDLFVDEAYYWDWAQTPAWGYYSKPPLIAWLIALSTALLGNSEMAVRAGSLCLHPLTAGLLFLLTRRWYGAAAACYTGIAYLLMPAVAFSSLFISTDVLLLLFWVLALYALAGFTEQPARYWPLLGLALGLGLLSKYSMALFFPCLLLWMWVYPPARLSLRQPYGYWAVLLAGLLFAPNLWWNWAHGFPTLRHTAEIAQLAQPGPHWDEFGEFLVYQGVLLGPGLMLLWLYSLGKSKWRQDGRSLLLLCFSVVPVLLLSVQALRGGAQPNWAAFAYPVALVFIVAQTLARGGQRGLWLAFTLNGCIMLGVYHHQQVLTAIMGQTQPGIDGFKRLRGWRELGSAVAAVQQAHPAAALLAEDRDLLAHLAFYVQPRPVLWSWNPEAKLRHHYDLTKSLALPSPGEYLFITRRWEVPDLRAHFASVQLLTSLQIPASPGRVIQVQVFQASDSSQSRSSVTHKAPPSASSQAGNT